MRATNFDWILQQEEKKLNKLLEGLNLTSSELNEVKSTNPTDKPGLVSRGSMRTVFNPQDNTQIEKKSVAVQTMVKPSYDVNDQLKQISSDRAEKPRAESFLTSINKWQSVVSDQLKLDLETQISDKSQELHEANDRIQVLERSLREMVQWRNSTLNYVTLALNSWDRNLAKGSLSSKVPPLLLQNIEELHKNILGYLHDDNSSSHLPENFEKLKINPKSSLREGNVPESNNNVLNNSINSRKTSPISGRMKSNVGNTNITVMTVPAPTMPFTVCVQCKKQTNLIDDILAANNVGPVVDSRNLAAVAKYQESTLANIFGILLSIQATAADFLLTKNTSSNNGGNENFMTVVNRRSSLARMSITDAALSAINNSGALSGTNNSAAAGTTSGNANGTTAPAKRRNSLMTSSSNNNNNADSPRSLDRKTFLFSFFIFDLFDDRFTLNHVMDFFNELQMSKPERSDRNKMNYVTFVKAWGIIAHAKFPGVDAREELQSLLRQVKPAYDVIVADIQHSVQRLAQVAGVVDTDIYALLSEYEETLFHAFKRSKNYGLNARTTHNMSTVNNTTTAGGFDNITTTNELAGSSFTSFEVFCINNHIVPNLISANATRRVTQFAGIIFKKDCVSFFLAALYLLAVLKSQIDELPTNDSDYYQTSMSVTKSGAHGTTTGGKSTNTGNISSSHVLPILQTYIAKVVKYT